MKIHLYNNSIRLIAFRIENQSNTFYQKIKTSFNKKKLIFVFEEKYRLTFVQVQLTEKFIIKKRIKKRKQQVESLEWCE